MTLGTRLKKARAAKGMSQSQVSGTFITRNMLSQLEHDQASPSLKTLEYLSSVLGVTISWLIGEESVSAERDTLKQARAYFMSGEYSQCLSLLQDIPDPVQEERLLLCRSFLQQGLLLFKNGEPENAKQFAENSVAQTNLCIYTTVYDRYLGCCLRMRCLIVLGQDTPAEYLTFFEQFQAFHPEEPAHLLQAAFALKENRLQDASQQLDALSPISEHALQDYAFLRGSLLVQKGMYSQALPFLLQAEEKNPFPPQYSGHLYYLLEQCYKEAEDFRMAYHYACLRFPEV